MHIDIGDIMKKLLSAMEAAKMLGKSKQQINNDIHNGKLKAQKVGNFWVIDRNDLKKFMRASKKK
jgi:excisionase family DNA binding protein